MKIPKSLIVFLVILAIGFAIWWVATKRRAKGGNTIGYQFFSQTDSPGSDLVHLPEYEGNIKDLKKACDDIPECLAFNTAGFLKGSVDPNQFKQYSGYPDWSGLYVKRKALR